MPAQQLGKAYEALFKVVLDELKSDGVIENQIFWNETPPGLSVEPDFVIGDSIDNPTIIFMITHLGSSKDSEKKCWRNLGELCECKLVFGKELRVFNIIFDSVMKEALKLIQDVACDYQMIIGDTNYGTALLEWVSNVEKDLPTDQIQKAETLKNRIFADNKARRLLGYLKQDIANGLMTKRPDDSLDAVWEMEKKRSPGSAPQAKKTAFRRGFAKQLLVGDQLKSKKLSKNEIEFLQKLGIITPSIGNKFHVSDEDLSWFMATKYIGNYNRISNLCCSEGFKQQLMKVRQLSLLAAYGEYVFSHYDELITKDGMLACMESQHADPANGIEVASSSVVPTTVWIYDYVSALLKGSAHRAQAFGYSAFATHKDAQKEHVAGMYMGQWCSHFAGEYFNRKSNFVMPEGSREFIAQVLSEYLATIKKSEIPRLRTEIESAFITKEFETTFLTHRGFEPLPAILVDEGIVNPHNLKVNIRTCFAEKANLAGQAGKTTVALAKHTAIVCKSVTDAGKDNKRRELCGRAVGIRYSWDNDSSKFVRREGIQKLILLLDGTWRQKDLDTLIRSGWDEIYYPDEIDKLKAAII